jgi:hypothetical protein
MTEMPGGEQANGEDRWYLVDEWRALPKDEQATIREARAARKKKGGGKTPSKGGPKKGGPRNLRTRSRTRSVSLLS